MSENKQYYYLGQPITIIHETKEQVCINRDGKLLVVAKTKVKTKEDVRVWKNGKLAVLESESGGNRVHINAHQIKDVAEKLLQIARQNENG